MFSTQKSKVRRVFNRGNFGGRQELVTEFYVFGIKVWTRVDDSEFVPAWAAIQFGALGYTDWKSKYGRYIP